MDPKLFAKTTEATPRFNPDVCRGYATKQMNNILHDMDTLITSASDLFPPELKFVGHKFASPIEQFRETTREYKSVRKGDVAQYDFFMVKYYFEYAGEMFPPFPVLVPFVREGGIFVHRGTTYSVSPALTDIGYSTTPNGLFFPFKRARYNFHKTDHNVMEDNVLTLTSLYYSAIHHEVKKTKGKRNLIEGNRPYIHSTLAHYLFAKWGFIDALNRFDDVEAEVQIAGEFDPRKYPQSKWTYFTSARWNASGHPIENLVVLVKKTSLTDYVRTMVGSFFYVVDAFPDEVNALEDVADPNFWMYLLGRIIKGDREARGTVLANMETHMASTDCQLDDITRAALKEVDIDVEDIYALFHVIMTDLAPKFLKTSTEETTMFNKRLTVIPYILHEFNEAITILAYHLQTVRKKPYSMSDIHSILKRTFKLKVCVNTLSNHGEVTAISSPGDNMILRITSVLIDAARGGPVRYSHDEGSFINNPARKLHASIAEVGSFTNLPQSMPDGRTRANPCMQLEYSGRVSRKEKFRNLIDETQAKIEGR